MKKSLKAMICTLTAVTLMGSVMVFNSVSDTTVKGLE